MLSIQARLFSRRLLRINPSFPARSSRSFASFSMAALKDLRAKSGAPMMECKKALQNTDGDLQAAMDWLREHGAAKASSKVQGRETEEGLVGVVIAPDHKTASLVKVAAETDFAGRSSKFVQLVLDIAEAATNPDLPEGNIEKTLDVQPLLDEAIVAIRENLSVASAVKLVASEENSILVGYVHNRLEGSNAGSAAAIVEVAGDVDMETLKSTGKKLAMHVVAANPEYMTPDDVPEEEVNREKEILANQIRDSGKPAEIVEKIVQGRMGKFYQQICLTEQAHMIEDSNPKVSKVLKQQGVTVKRFKSLTI